MAKKKAKKIPKVKLSIAPKKYTMKKAPKVKMSKVKYKAPRKWNI